MTYALFKDGVWIRKLFNRRGKMLISVYGTDYFETTGIRLETFDLPLFCDYTDAPHINDTNFNLDYDKVKDYKLPYGRKSAALYLLHHQELYNKGVHYNEVFSNCLETKIDKEERSPYCTVRGTKIITGSRTAESSYYDHGKRRDINYIGSFDTCYYVWFRTQEEVANKINKQLKELRK